MANIRCVLWDWNGTLLDDVGASLAAVNDMLARRHRPAIDLLAYREAIGVPIRRFYNIHFDMTQENYPALLSEYSKDYTTHLTKCNLASGAIALLKKLHFTGVLQVILSSSEQKIVENALARYNVAQYFDAVLGASDYFADSKLERAREYLRVQTPPPKQVLLMGDLVHDFDVAQELGTQCVLVNWGHQGEAQFVRLGAQVISSLCELELLPCSPHARG
ncbi:MAG: HAD family hydrolase [Oscillospiraceae bacterium]|jgi:phosphoglycolate phosphatase|nr:HAD family hydrolase [Oscillospiraceae bacterium]